MIITRTPFRMSFFGGGTDLPEFFNVYGGSVISTTIDKYCYVTARKLPPFFDYSTELVYSRIERVSSPEEIEHPLVRNALQYLKLRNLRIGYEADLPARSGLGTSSSFAVGLLNALHSLMGEHVSKMELAEEAIMLERELCSECGGWQDQVAAAYGGLNRIDFADNSFEVRPIIIPPERKRYLNDCLLLFFTGFTRFSSDMQKSNRITEKNGLLREMLALVDEAENALVNSAIPLSRLGSLLNDTWNLKRCSGDSVSTSLIDELYDKGRKAGALGGKLLGAGGGGFLLFYVEPDAQDSVKTALSDMVCVPISLERSGTSVCYYEPES